MKWHFISVTPYRYVLQYFSLHQTLNLINKPQPRFLHNNFYIISYSLNFHSFLIVIFSLFPAYSSWKLTFNIHIRWASKHFSNTFNVKSIYWKEDTPDWWKFLHKMVKNKQNQKKEKKKKIKIEKIFVKLW